MIRAPMHLILAGVSGSGKSTIGRLLAERSGAQFLDGDSLHSVENLAKMRAGAPLNDADRDPWLRAIGEAIDAQRARDVAGIVACSALKRAYRDRLRHGRSEVWIALLSAPADELERRLKARRGHFVAPSLLASQIATLEPIAPGEERAFTVEAVGEPEDIADAIADRLRRAGAAASPRRAKPS